MQLPEGKSKRLVIASAGSGKTQRIVGEAITATARVLITTYTEANEAEIRSRFVKECGCVPAHVTIQTWYSFLIQHGARPFQGAVPSPEIRGLVIPDGSSAQWVSESDTERHYFTADHKIYSDKLAKFAIKCNSASGGAVVDRLARVYDVLFVDEVQDIAGHDLDFLKLLLQSPAAVTLVGDPRQSVYATSRAARNRKYRGDVLWFFEDASIDIERDLTSLTTNHRCVPEICALSDELFPDLPATKSGQALRTGHDGVFLVGKTDVEEYLREYGAVQLRYRADTKQVVESYRAYNFGLSKGMQFDRVLIFPTKDMVIWLSSHAHELAPETRAKLYVALTRARYSVGIVTDEVVGARFGKYHPHQS
jgi:DNA helicase-2/ATP-dependent DNA helicase PcrA